MMILVYTTRYNLFPASTRVSEAIAIFEIFPSVHWAPVSTGVSQRSSSCLSVLSSFSSPVLSRYDPLTFVLASSNDLPSYQLPISTKITSRICARDACPERRLSLTGSRSPDARSVSFLKRDDYSPELGFRIGHHVTTTIIRLDTIPQAQASDWTPCHTSFSDWTPCSKHNARIRHHVTKNTILGLDTMLQTKFSSWTP